MDSEPSPSTPRRRSITQLPLPSSLIAGQSGPSTGTGSQRSQAQPASPTQALFFKAGGPPTMSGGKTFGVTSPTSPSRHHGTHVGGIQPSASFFRPSKPSDQQHFTTARHDPYPPTSDADAFPLSSISQSHRHSASSEDQSLAHGGHDSLSMTDENFNTRKSNKSRDPLLPIGEKPTPLSSRPSMTRDLSGAGSTNTIGHTRSPTASNIVRNSLELVFNLRRGMSIDSIRRMGGSSNALASRVKAEGDSKHFDEEEENRYPMGVARKSSYADSVHSRTPSPAPSFLPSPPEPQNPPLNAVPIINPDTGKPYRNHELHPSRNRFFFGGRILVGGDSPWAFIMTFSILIIITGTWFGTTCIWWWQNESPAVAAVVLYLALIVISSMLTTAFRDPGILPRNLDPDPPFPATSPQDGIRAPLPRDLKVRSDVVRVKYCPTCKTYRPPRSSHCKMCNNCVDGCDHHCQWVNNCIGRRNYTSFVILLFTAILTIVLVICTSALHLFYETRRTHTTLRHTLTHGQAIGSAVAFFLSILIFWPVAALLSYHLRLLLLNVTTIEQIRNQAHKTLFPGQAPPNPFSHGSWRKNVIAVLCRPPGFSWLDGHGIATEDNRKVNPGAVEG